MMNVINTSISFVEIFNISLQTTDELQLKYFISFDLLLNNV